MPDPILATRPLPSGVAASPTWAPEVSRADGEPADRIALRWTWATEPAELMRYAGRPGHALEVAHLIAAESPPSILVAGWGSQSGAVGRLVRTRVADLLPLVSRPWHALGTCADGAPRHPLFMPREAPLTPWAGR